MDALEQIRNNSYLSAEKNEFPCLLEYKFKNEAKKSILFMSLEKYNDFLLTVLERFSKLEKKKQISFEEFFQNNANISFEDYNKIKNNISESTFSNININGNPYSLEHTALRVERHYPNYVKDIQDYNKMIDFSLKAIESGLENLDFTSLKYISDHNHQITSWAKNEFKDIR